MFQMDGVMSLRFNVVGMMAIMANINVTNVKMKKIIEKLASKELSFGCLVESEGEIYKVSGEDFMMLPCYLKQGALEVVLRSDKILGHPVYKHHVEKYLRENGILYQNLEKLTLLWEHFNFEKSLQQIAEKSGYETGYLHDGEFIPSECTVEVTRLKDPKARKLEQFISNLIL